MNKVKPSLGIREYIAIALALSSTKLTDDVPSLLFKQGENSSWMIIIGTAIFASIPIYLLVKMISEHEENCLFEVIHDACGKVFGNILLFICWSFLTMQIIIISATYVDIIGTMYFIKTPHLFIYATFLGVCGYAAMKGIQHIGSVSWLCFIPITIAFLLALILTITKGSFTFLFPILGPGVKEIMTQSMIKVAIYIDFFFICFLATYMRHVKEFKKGTWIAFVVVVFELTIAVLSYILLFDYKTVQLFNYPHHEAIRFISAGFLTNLELFFFPFWAIATFVRFSVYIYIQSLIFGRLFRIENSRFIIPAVIAIVISIGLIPEAPSLTVFKIHTYALHGSSIGFILIPLLLWILLHIRKRVNSNVPSS